MDLRLLGNVEIHDSTCLIPLPRAGERCVLASLALEPGRRINVDTLIDRLWGDDQPASAGPTVASYVRTVRRAIEAAGGRRDWVRNHRPGSYQLNIDPSLVDYHRFTALVDQARGRRREREPAEAVTLYRKALDLRRGEALGNVTGQWAANRRYSIEQEHRDAICALYEQQLSVGEYAAVATHATHLVLDVVPTDRMIALAVHGLARSGQHAAIQGFLTRAAKRMWETAGARPGAEVLAIARQLIVNPNAQLRSPSPVPAGAPLPDLPDTDAVDVDDAEPASAPTGDGGEPAAHRPAGSGSVTMTAEHNQQVYQAAGDQYVIRPWDGRLAHRRGGAPATRVSEEVEGGT